jgi:hypothetical protein
LLQVAAGAQVRNIDVILARTRTVSVTGRVRCEVEGQKVTMSLMLVPRVMLGITNMGMGSRGAAVKPDGIFEFPRVPPGGYMLTVSATVDDKRYWARVPVQVGSTNVEGVVVAIHAGATVTGKLRVEGREREQEKVAGLNVGLRSWQSGGIIFGPIPTIKTAEDGSFQLEDVGMDHYSFYVHGLPDGYYLKSVRSGGVDVMALGLEVAGGSAPLDVLISPNAGGLEGTVMDSRAQKPAASATVVLVPRVVERSDLYYRMTSDADGRFRAKNVVPGDYRVYAWEDVPVYAWMDPDFMRGMDSKGQSVTVPEGSPQSVQLTLIAR